MINTATNITRDKSFEKNHHFKGSENNLVRISPGISVSGALELANCPENKGKKIVIILTGNGDPNLSMGNYQKREVKPKPLDLFWSF
jgi:cysteine synthase